MFTKSESKLTFISNDDAFTRSQSFIFAAKIAKEYAQQQIEEAEIRLKCCRIHVSLIFNYLKTDGFSFLTLSKAHTAFQCTLLFHHRPHFICSCPVCPTIFCFRVHDLQTN